MSGKSCRREGMGGDGVRLDSADSLTHREPQGSRAKDPMYPQTSNGGLEWGCSGSWGSSMVVTLYLCKLELGPPWILMQGLFLILARHAVCTLGSILSLLPVLRL